MASPQLENGYTKIANELYDALISWHLSSYEYRVFIFIVRKTYGWNKKEDWISLSQFVLGTKIRESHISRTLGLLIKQNMITKGGNRRMPKWGIQKDFDKWIKLPKGVRSHHNLKKGVSDVKGGNSNSKKGGDTKETNTTKEINTRHKVGGLSINKNSMKKNSFNYNESASSDSYEEIVDAESGEISKPKKTNATEKYWSMIKWAEERRGFKFLSVPKQFKAFSLARTNSIDPSSLKNRWIEFEGDKFWQSRGWDWMDIIHSFNKKR